MSTTNDRKRDILEGVKINGKVRPLRQIGKAADPSEPDTARLARLLPPMPRTTAVSSCASLVCTPVAFHE